MSHPVKTSTLSTSSVAFLDLLRAIAANLVLVGHGLDIFDIKHDLPLGLIGVSLFFLLSGFLILQSSLTRVHRPAPYFLPYIIDRFSRIFTAYVPILLLIVFVESSTDLGHWGQNGISSGPVAFLGNLFLLQDYPVFQIAQRIVGETFYIRPYNTAEPLWAIPVEFWIYVVFGLGFFGLVMRERLDGLLYVALGIVALPVVIWNAAAGGGNGLSLVWLLGAMGGYTWSISWRCSSHKFQIGAVVLVVACICLLGRGAKIGWNFQDLGMALCEALIMISCISMLENSRALPSFLSNLCAFLASYSYSLYLAHNTILIVVKRQMQDVMGKAALPFGLVAAHAIAYVLYLLFERKYRLVGSWLKSRSAHISIKERSPLR